MPTVPRVTQQSIQATPTEFKRQNIQTSAETFGGGAPLDKVVSAAGNLVKTVIDIEDKEIKAANDLAIREADLAVAKKFDELDNIIISTKGKNAFGLPDQINPEADKYITDVRNTLANDYQKEAFDRSAMERRYSLDKGMGRHITGERMRYDDELTKSFITNEQELVKKNPHDMEGIAMSLANQRKAILEQADRMGLSEEGTTQALQSVASQTHMGAIESMISNETDMEAKAYLDKVRKYLTGDDEKKAVSLVESATLRGESQRTSDAIWLKSNGDLGTALNNAEKIEDPKLRDETERRIRDKDSKRNASIKSAQDMNFLDASEYVKKGDKLASPQDTMPIAKWEALTLQQQKALSRMHSEDINDDKIWLDFYSKPAQEIASMSRADFEAQWMQMSGPHRNRAEAMWKSGQSGGAADPRLTNALSFKDRIDNTLKTANILPLNKPASKYNNAEASIYNEFESEAAKRLEEFEVVELGGKRRATGKEIQGIFDKMLIEKVYVDKAWLPFTKDVQPVSVWSLPKSDRGDAFIPYESINDDEKLGIGAKAKAAGHVLSRAKMEKLVGAYRMKDRDLFNKILKEN